MHFVSSFIRFQVNMIIILSFTLFTPTQRKYLKLLQQQQKHGWYLKLQFVFLRFFICYFGMRFWFDHLFLQVEEIILLHVRYEES